MRFSDIIGQEDVKKQLRQAVSDGRIAHAQLFTGMSGIGKLPLAIAYAQYIACPYRTAEDSCGTCPTCLQYQKLQHPDLHFVFPIVKSDNGDVCDSYIDKFRSIITNTPYFNLDDWYQALEIETKQAIIYEKESTEILRKLSLKSFSDGYKVMIIWLPEKMNIECANKLLKLLEEPPIKTLFLLVSEQPELLLSTIISRSQEIRIPRLSEHTIAHALQQNNPDISATTINNIAHNANGSYLTAIKQLNDCAENKQYFNDFVALMRNAWLVGQKKDYSALLQLRKWSLDIADAKVGREKQKSFLQYAQRQIRENYIYNFSCAEMNYQTEDERQFSSKFAPFIHEDNVERMMEELSRAEQQISQNGNAKIIFFDLCLQMIVTVKK
ncbi:MAG: DNA polymerase III subunit delta [Paludibacteraceae bacterium]|jgi:DNA polymerase-3 subunit delta'|nr:DNA polymerase III subunit delta [Paludibacteraceae bacterium]